MHLPDQVPKHGPLILDSSFLFEAMISHLKWQFMEPIEQSPKSQGTCSLPKNAGSLIKRETMEPEVKSFIEEHIITKKDESCHHFEGHCYFMLPFTNNPELSETVIQQLDLQGQEVHLTNRMVINW